MYCYSGNHKIGTVPAFAIGETGVLTVCIQCLLDAPVRTDVDDHERIIEWYVADTRIALDLRATADRERLVWLYDNQIDGAEHSHMRLHDDVEISGIVVNLLDEENKCTMPPNTMRPRVCDADLAKRARDVIMLPVMRNQYNAAVVDFWPVADDDNAVFSFDPTKAGERESPFDSPMTAHGMVIDMPNSQISMCDCCINDMLELHAAYTGEKHEA